MQKLLFSFLIIFLSFPAFSQSNKNITLLSQYTYSSARGNGNDIWGYVDGSGNEYAIMGLENGVSIVDISTPGSPVEVFYQSGTQTTWRDIKVWNDYAYITNEGGNGLMIIDLNPLPGSTSLTVSYFTGNTFPFQTAHNLYIDENGICYVFGSDYGNGGAIMLDLTSSATNPTEVGIYDSYYLHDGMARGDTLWGAAVNDGFFAVIDVSTKSSPSTLASQLTPHSFAHNCWVSDDGDYLYTTDEKSDAFVAAYDVSSINNITEVDRVQSNPGSGVIPHNTHFMNEYLITSYYRDGVTIHDVSNPDNVVEVGNYDTSPLSGDGFDGCWGVYPWLPSGNIIASDMQGGLFVLGPTYNRACFIDGKVTENGSGAPLGNAQIEILSTTITDLTNVNGDYKSGVADSGTYNVRYFKGGYVADTVSVTMYHDSTVTVNVALDPLPSFTLNGKVVEKNTNNGIENAILEFIGQNGTFNAQTNSNGEFSVNQFYNDDYDIAAGKWGYKTNCLNNVTLDSTTGNYIIELEIGYYDDFRLDLGWTESGTASAGKWERGKPNGTFLSGAASNPGSDVSGDCGDQAYVTGNAPGSSVGDDDIDDGGTQLRSQPMDLTFYKDPHINYYRWFYNDGGWGSPDDEMFIRIDNGDSTALLDHLTSDSLNTNQWINKDYRVKDYVDLSPNMRLTVYAVDQGTGHIVEAGFDLFQITGDTMDTTSPTGIVENVKNNFWTQVNPNPFNREFSLNYHFPGASGITLTITDVTGKTVFRDELNPKLKNYKVSELKTPGLYFINLIDDKGRRATKKVIKRE